MLDWLIIGGGVPALVSAYYLQQRGLQVLVTDNANPSASRAGAGILSPLPPWRCPQPQRQLAADGAAAYPKLLASLDDTCGYHQCGMVVLPPFDNTALQHWQADGGAAAAIDTAAVSDLLAAQPALHLPCVAVLQSRRLVKQLRRRLKRQQAEVAELLYDKQRVAKVRLANGSTLRAENILLSAGAWSGRLAPPPPLPIQPVRGEILLYDNPGIVLPKIILHEQNNFYLLQRRDGRLLAGSTSTAAGFDAAVSQEGVALLKQRVATVLPLLATTAPRAAWAGLRPASPRPIIAAHPHIKNLYINSGHFRYGVTMAPAAAAHLLQLIDGNISEQENRYGYPTPGPPSHTEL